MIEEAEHPFPPPDDTMTNHSEDDSGSDAQAEEPDEPASARISDQPEEPEEPNEEERPQLIASSSTGSEGETTGPSTAENSISQVPPVEYEPKQIVGGRASIPEELEPHQLARLKDLKESNA